MPFEKNKGNKNEGKKKYTTKVILLFIEQTVVKIMTGSFLLLLFIFIL